MQHVPSSSESPGFLTHILTKNLRFLEKLIYHSKAEVNVNKIQEIYKRIIPLTLPNVDPDGNTIQLWKVEKYGLIGSVTDRSGNLQIIPSDRIVNPLSMGVQGDDLVKRLENCTLKRWSIVFNRLKRELIIWPHLVAAGIKNGDVGKIYDYHKKLDSKTLCAAAREKNGDIPKLKDSGTSYDHVTKVEEKRKGLDDHIARVQKKLDDPNLPGDQRQKLETELAKSENWATYVDKTTSSLNYKAWRVGVNKLLHTDQKVWVLFNKHEKVLAKQSQQQSQATQSKTYGAPPRDPPGRQTTLRQADPTSLSGKSVQQTRHMKEADFKARTIFNRVFNGSAPRTPPRGGGGSGGLWGYGSPRGGNPSTRQFQQTLQQTKLTSSYNSTHRSNPVPNKGGADIGGVACGLEYIEGLLDSPESLMEDEHYFCVADCDGTVPFTNEELKQILRELAIGIYVHGAVPFFSLHFRQETADLFPVIHPAYENTLVGRVISMLDYFMKGYLNGGVFSEEFIDEWHKDPNWKRKKDSALQELIDFEEYCKAHLEGKDQEYISARSLQILQGILSELFEGRSDLLQLLEEKLGAMLTEQPSKLLEFEGFRNSFRIIAMQNSFQKKGNLFLMDSDFRVEYTLEPSPEYAEELERYERKKGELPPYHQVLITIYEHMRRRIHDHMVKMPLCRKYFSMLGVINFFSSYFSTLKKYRKIPALSVFEMEKTVGCPPLFPHIPLSNVGKEGLQLNLRECIREFFPHFLTKEYFSKLFRHLVLQKGNLNKREKFDPAGYKQIVSLLGRYLERHICASASKSFSRYIKNNKQSIKLDEFTDNQAASLLNTIFDSFVQATSSAKEALGSKLLETIEDQGRVEKFIRLFVHDLIEDFPSGKEGISKEFTYQTTHIYPELTEKTIEKSKRIVGGCGMELTKQRIQPSKKAEEVLHSNWNALLKLPPETWEIVDTEEGTKGAVFRLLLEDVPPWLIDNYSWMESFLLVPKGTTPEVVERRLELQEAIFSGNQAEFTKYLEETENVEELRDGKGATLLHHAATMKDPFYVQALLDKGLSISELDAHGYLPIHYAAMTDCIEVIKLFLAKHLKTIDATSNYGSTPLIVAIQHGQVEAVRILLANRPNPCLLAGGYTDLHCALHEGNLEIINALLDCEHITSFAINVCSEEGGTPLMLACELDNPELVRKLIQKGAKVSTKRKDGTTAIEVAIRRDAISILKVLLEHALPSGLAMETCAKEGSVEMMKLLPPAGVLEYTNTCKDTLLHIALRYGNVPVALYLTQYLELYEVENIEGYSPFSLAIFMEAWEVAEKLFRSWVKIDLPTVLRAGYHPLFKEVFERYSLTSRQLQEYLMIAAEAGNHLAIDLVLIPKGADIEKLRGPKGWKIAHYLAKSDGASLLRELVAKNGDLLAPLIEEGNKTLAYIAAEHGSSHVASYLVGQMKYKGVSFHKHYRDRHLFYAILESGDLDLMKEILEMETTLEARKALVDQCLDAQEMRLVHVAAKNGHAKILKFLIDEDANCHVRDKENRTPLYYAIRSGSKKCVSLLLKQKLRIEARDLYEAASLPPPFKHKMLKRLLEAYPSQERLNAALYLAIENHNEAAFAELYQTGASFNHVTADGWTPLLLASSTGQIDMLKTILMHSLSDEIVGGNNALHLACINGHVHCIKLLMEMGFKLNPNEQGQTPLELAKDQKMSQDILQGEATYQAYLKEYKNALEADDAPRMKEALKKLPPQQSIFLEYEGKRVWGTPLQLLIRFCQEKKVKGLIAEFDLSNLNLPDSEGNTIAHFIANIGEPLLHVANIDFTACNHLGQTPLHLAAREAESTVLEAMLKLLPASEIHAVDRRGRTPIFYAIEGQKEKNIPLLLKAGADLRHRDHQLFTPLFVAWSVGSLPILKILMTNGADPNQWATSKKLLPLHITMMQKQSELTRYLLLHGAKRIPLEKDGSHPIHHAAQSGDLESLRMFVGMGDSINLKDHMGRGLKHHAVIGQEMDSLKTIWKFEEKALAEKRILFGKSVEGLQRYWKSEESTINAPLKLKSEDDRTHPLEGANLVHLAARSSNPQMLDWLLQQGVSATAKTTKEKNALYFAAQSPLAPDMLKRFSSYKMSKNFDSIEQAVVETIRQDHLEAVIGLYKDTLFPRLPVMHGSTGLHLACYFGALQCTAWFLQEGADPTYEDSSRKTAFELAAENQSPEQFQLLLEYTNHDPNHKYRRGNILLHNAAAEGQLKHVALLLLQGSSVNTRDMMGFTPLHHAVQRENLEIVRLLLACGADPSIRATLGPLPVDLLRNSPAIGAAIRRAIEDSESIKEYREKGLRLHLAVASNHPIAVLLLTRIQNVDEQDGEGRTPLHLAVQRGAIESAMHLLRAGADDELQDHFGHTPLWYAERLHSPLREKILILFQKASVAV